MGSAGQLTLQTKQNLQISNPESYVVISYIVTINEPWIDLNAELRLNYVGMYIMRRLPTQF